MYTVYVLYSEKFNKTYTGYTSDLSSRINSHNQLSTTGYTRKYRPWVLLYTEVYETKKEAIRREKQLKTGKGRDWIKQLIQTKYASVRYPPQH